jgi:Bacterial PH domain
LKLAGLMGVFFVFAVAVLLDESLLAGDGLRNINHRGTQVAFVCMTFATVARMLPMALADLLDEEPAVRLDATGGEVRSFVRRRRFRWEDVVALEGSPRYFRIRLARGRPIRVTGKFEGDPEPDVRSHARRLWTAAVTP